MISKHEYMNIAPPPPINDAGYTTGVPFHFVLIRVEKMIQSENVWNGHCQTFGS